MFATSVATRLKNIRFPTPRRESRKLIGQLLAIHLGPHDPLRPYAQRLHDPTLQSELRGYLSGSLDLVFRTPDRR